MKKLGFILLTLISLSSNALFADQGLYLIQITQPEKKRIDIKFHSFFSLRQNEEVALQALSNKGTLHTYEKLIKNPHQIKIDKLTYVLAAQPLGRRGEGGSAQGLLISVLKDKTRILEEVALKEQDFSEISLIVGKDENSLILSLTPNGDHKKENYEIKINSEKSLTSYDSIKKKSRSLNP